MVIPEQKIFPGTKARADGARLRLAPASTFELVGRPYHCYSLLHLHWGDNPHTVVGVRTMVI